MPLLGVLLALPWSGSQRGCRRGDRLQKGQDAIPQGRPSEIQVPTKRSGPSMQLVFFARLSVWRVFCFLFFGTELAFFYILQNHTYMLQLDQICEQNLI